MSEATVRIDMDKLTIGHNARTLTGEEIYKLEKDTNILSDFKQKKLEVEAQKNWDLFYKRNTTKFFKDRHWTKREFAELLSEDCGVKTVLEVGCGVGNFLFPLIEEDKSLFFYACDFSKRAVEFVKSHPKYDSTRCRVFHCDLTIDDLRETVPTEGVDAVSMIFVLSAIHPDKMLQALTNIFRVLRHGGCVLLRDYGLYDYAMLRFAPGHKLEDNFYVRQDGTRAFYFSLEKLEDLMVSAGFEVDKSEYVQRTTVNKKEGLSVPRVFVQGRFVKPGRCEASVCERPVEVPTSHITGISLESATNNVCEERPVEVPTSHTTGISLESATNSVCEQRPVEVPTSHTTGISLESATNSVCEQRPVEVPTSHTTGISLESATNNVYEQRPVEVPTSHTTGISLESATNNVCEQRPVEVPTSHTTGISLESATNNVCEGRPVEVPTSHTTGISLESATNNASNKNKAFQKLS